MSGVTGVAVALIAGADAAGVMLIEDGEFRSVAHTAVLVSEVEALEQRLRQGPSLAAARAGSAVRCTDLRGELRWPDFATAAIQLGVRSMLSFPLHTHSGSVGVLNLLGRSPQFFTAEAEAIGTLLATHASLALSTIARQHEFDAALSSRDTIGQAKGIFMERHGLDATQAFALLTRCSQHTRTPLREVAAELVRSHNQRHG